MSDYTLLIGDALEQLRTLPSDSVHCCVTSPPYFGLRAYLPIDHPDRVMEIGLEYTPDQFVARLVEVFREVRRVLHPTGVAFINLGDTYHGGGGGNYGDSKSTRTHNDHLTNVRNRVQFEGIKPKDLIGIPWLVAFALRADGWWLRQEIIWHKLAPMPESVTDRCTKAHEQVFLLAKSERYFFDAEAIREPLAEGTEQRYGYGFGSPDKKGVLVETGKWHTGNNGRNNLSGDMKLSASGRNKRSVWTLSPEQFHGAHYAVMPTKLVEPCVLAGTSAHGCCSKCLAPWERVVEVERPAPAAIRPKDPRVHLGHSSKSTINQSNWHDDRNPSRTSTTLGWQPTCTCNAPVQPCVVLDPFAGSGTTLACALKFGRRAIGIDLDPRNARLVRQRIEQTQPLLISIT